MIHIKSTCAAGLLAAALLSGDAAAQDRVVRLPERDRPLAGTPAQVFAIGRENGAAHETFGIVAGVAFDASDNLYVLDRQASRIMVYDRTGRFIRQIGKQGEGPGELMVPVQLAIGGDGTVIVSDMGRPGYSLFRPDGTFLRNVLLESAILSSTAGMGWHPRGGIVSTFRQPPPPSQQGSTTQTLNVLPLVFQPLGGGAPARLFNIPQTVRVEQRSDAPGQVNVRTVPPPAFSPAILFGVIPNGQIALSFTSGYTVRILDPNGNTLRYLQRPVRARLTTNADRERAREQRRESIRSGRGVIRIQTGGGGGPAPGRSPQDLERSLSEMEFADTIPALNGLRVAPSGKLWIGRTGPVIGGPGPIDLVTPEGQYLGTITGSTLPEAISRNGLAAYVERDENDVERVVVRRLPEGWR